MRNKQPRGGIERKVVAPLLWVGVIPMALALIIGYLFAHEGQRLAVQQNLATAAQKTAEGLQLALNARLRTVRTLAEDPEIVRALSAIDRGEELDIVSLQNRLEVDAKNAEDGPAQLTLYDAEGKLLVSTGRVSDDERRHEDWVYRVREVQFVNFDYVAHELRYVAQIAAPVYALRSRQCLGYVSKLQGVNSLLKFALTHRAHRGDKRVGSDTYQVAFKVSGGTLVSYFDETADRDPPPLKYEPADDRLAAQLHGADGGGVSGSLRLGGYATRGTNIDVLLAYHQLFESEGAYLVVYRPTSAVYANINLGAAIALAGSVLVIAFFCVIAYRNAHNNIVRPIGLLNEGAQIIRQGDLDLKLKIETHDELEQLASSFNEMARVLKKNIRQLAESEEKYRNLVTSLRDGVCQTDKDGVLTFINPAGARILGFSDQDRAVGQQLRTMFLEDGDFSRMIKELSANGFVDWNRLWMRRHDGEPICVELSANRIVDDHGEVIGAEGLLRDVTKRVQLEQEARERSERIRVINQIANAINSSLEVGRLYESIAAEMKKLIDFDYAAVTLLNEAGDTFERRRLWPEQRPDEQPTETLPIEGSYVSLVTQNRAHLIIDDLSGDAGSEISATRFAGRFPPDIRSCISVPLYATGRIIGTLAIGSTRPGAFTGHHAEVLDEMAPHVAVAIRNAQLLDNLQSSLDEVTHAQEKLHQANEELKTLDEMKTNLLSNVSHELRTPLVSIMGYTDMVINEKAGPVTETQREYLGISLRNVEKLVTLIENLLDFSRLHRGAEELVFDTFNLTECVHASMQLVKPVADGRDIVLELNAPDAPVLVEGDKAQIGQVFNNLLSNAVKFNENGGRVSLDIRPTDESVDIAVRDTGIGIPQEALDKVFTRFYQYDSSSTRKYGGTGIGLSISQDIVRLHGGRITVESRPGEGSVFRFSLPLPSGARRHEEPDEELTGWLVEVVCEDRSLSNHLRNVLLSEGIDAIHAAHADRAVALACKHNPDCMLVDVETDGNGAALLDRLLTDDACAGIPVVMLTNDETVYEAYRSRVASRVKRSFRKSMLLSAIRAVVHDAPSPGARGGGRSRLSGPAY